MVKINLRLQATVGTSTGQVGAAQAAAAAADQAAANAQAVATAAGNADRFRPAAPPKYGNKKKDADVKQWIPIIEDYLRTAPNADYIQLASFYLEGGPRSMWTSVYEAWKAANGGAEAPNPRQFSERPWKTTMASRTWSRSTRIPGTPSSRVPLRLLASTISSSSRP
jgi:hypothetical protein